MHREGQILRPTHPIRTGTIYIYIYIYMKYPDTKHYFGKEALKGGQLILTSAFFEETNMGSVIAFMADARAAGCL